MLRTLRERQKGLLIFVFILVAVSFGFLFNASDSGFFGPKTTGNTEVLVDETPVTRRDGSKVRNQLQYLSALATPTSFSASQELSQTLMSIRGYQTTMQNAGFQQLAQLPDLEQNQLRALAESNIVANIYTLRAEAKRLGIQVTLDQVQQAITRLPALRDPSSGQFSPARLELLLGSGLPLRSGTLNLSSLGTDGEAQLYRLVEDWLLFQKVTELLQIAVPANAAYAQTRIELNRSQTTSWLIHGNIDSYLPAADEEIDEDQLADWYQDHITDYYSAETRQVQLAIAQAPASTPAEPASAQTTEDSQLLADSDQELENTQPSYSDEDYLRAGNRIDNFALELSQGADFEQYATDNDFQLITLDAISRDPQVALPEPVTGLEQLRQVTFQTNPDWAMAQQAIEDRASGRLIILRVLDITEPAEQKLSAVREQVIQDWRRSRAIAQLQSELETYATTLENQLQAGESLDQYPTENQQLRIEGPLYLAFDSLQALPPSQAQSLSETLIQPIGKPTAIINVASNPQAEQPDRSQFSVASQRVTLAEPEQQDSAQTPAQIAQGIQQNLIQTSLQDWLLQARQANQISLPGVPNQ